MRFNAVALLASLLVTLSGLLLLSALLAQHRLQSEAVLQADTLAASLAPTLTAKDASTARALILNAGIRPELQAVAVYDSQGHSFVSWNALGQFNGAAEPAPSPRNNAVQTAWSFGQLSVAAPILLEDEIIGRLQLHTSVVPLYQELLSLLLAGLVLIALVLAVACYRLTRQQISALAPVYELCDTSEHVVNLNDYSVRIWNDGNHEFANLTQHFNQMLARINTWESSAEASIRERREQEQKVEILDNHDSLTKLPNRHYFHRALVHHVDEALASGELAALMFIDLDDFKSVNDEYGYEAGDFVLATIATRLCATLRGTDTLCRIGGDEFAAILPQTGSLALAETLADRLLAAIRQPIALYGKKLVVSASIGLSCAPLHAQEQRQLLRGGDLALAAAKAAGKDTYRTFKPT
ncbi:MAG: diguanylate cyclase [Pseudomonadota bacterium]